MILTGKSLNTYGIKSTDLEQNKKRKGKFSENMCLCQFPNQSQVGDHCGGTTGPPICLLLPAQLLVFSSAVAFSTALINNMLTLGRKWIDSIFSNSWEVWWWWEELSRSQLTVTFPALTQHMTDVTMDGCHRCCRSTTSKIYKCQKTFKLLKYSWIKKWICGFWLLISMNYRILIPLKYLFAEVAY